MTQRITRDLSRLLRPRSIAVFGGVWAENVVEQCRRMNFSGEIYAVNPSRADLCGIPCVASAAALPCAPDAAFLGINRHAAVDAARALSSMGCGGVVCFASGFAETGDDELQRQLVDAAGDMPLLGPNCYGVINFLDGALLWPDQHGGKTEKTGVAIVGQSSNILINITSQRRGLPLAYVAAAGNQAQTSMADIARGMLADERVRALGLHIEGVGDAAEFAAMAEEAARRGVGLVAVKAGACESSAIAAGSHTAALTGAAAASSAFLRRCGVAEVRTIAEMLETLKLLHVHGKRCGRKIMSLSCSGGEAGHIADLASDMSLSFPPPPPHKHRQLSEILGSAVRVANPLDYQTYIWRERRKLYETYHAAMHDGCDLTFLIYDYPRGDRCDWRDWQPPMEEFVRAAVDAGATSAANAGEDSAAAVVVSLLPENMPEEIAQMLLKKGIAPLCGLPEALAAAEAAAVAMETTCDAWRPLPCASTVSTAQKIMQDEHTAKVFLQKHGIACPQGCVATSPQKLQEAATTLAENMPEPAAVRFAVKQLGVAHKTDGGGVRLHVRAADVAAACEDMPSGDGFLAEEMIAPAAAELLLCVRREPVYGAALVVGIGGAQAELLNDVAVLILPATREEIATAIRGLRLAPLLFGFRGAPAVNIDAAVDAAHRLSLLIESVPGIAEIEINPLLLLVDGRAIAADALMFSDEKFDTGGAKELKTDAPPARQRSAEFSTTGGML